MDSNGHHIAATKRHKASKRMTQMLDGKKWQAERQVGS